MKVKVFGETKCLTFTYYVGGGFLFPVAESAVRVRILDGVKEIVVSI